GCGTGGVGGDRLGWVGWCGFIEVRLQRQGVAAEELFVGRNGVVDRLWAGTDGGDTLRYVQLGVATGRLHGTDIIACVTFGSQRFVDGGIENDKTLRDNGYCCFRVFWVFFYHGGQGVFGLL